jgi:SAM-dependent methyltransferase
MFQWSQGVVLSESSRRVPDDYVVMIREFFDTQYRLHSRYWWRGDNRYSVDPASHTPFHAAVLRQAKARKAGRVLDVGAGEGADAIRLAKLGYQVDAVELSPVACEKMDRFARDERVRINVINESVLATELSPGAYDMILLNGSLHYIFDKRSLLAKLRRASSPTAFHAISLFSSTTPLSSEHNAVPVFPDDEDGLVEELYRADHLMSLQYVTSKREESHPGFPEHSHSFIKLMVELSE